jgi:hypothetical protein
VHWAVRCRNGGTTENLRQTWAGQILEVLLVPMPLGELFVTQAAFRHAHNAVLGGIGPGRRLHLGFVNFRLVLAQSPLRGEFCPAVITHQFHNAIVGCDRNLWAEDAGC